MRRIWSAVLLLALLASTVLTGCVPFGASGSGAGTPSDVAWQKPVSGRPIFFYFGTAT
jgi:hypothetical protein